MSKRRKRPSKFFGLGGTKTEHVGAAEYYVREAEKRLKALPGSCDLSLLVDTAWQASAARTEGSWVGVVTGKDKRLIGRISDAEEGVEQAKLSFAKRCVR